MAFRDMAVKRQDQSKERQQRQCDQDLAGPVDQSSAAETVRLAMAMEPSNTKDEGQGGQGGRRADQGEETAMAEENVDPNKGRVGGMNRLLRRGVYIPNR